MRYIHKYALLWILVFGSFCKGPSKTELAEDSIKSETEKVITITSSRPNWITRTIKQDREGNVWIAAFDGVFRFDGKSFANITSEVSSARFFSVLEDQKGNFWFSSVGSGVYYYDGTSFRNFTTNDGLANDRVTDIYEDKTGDVWFSTEGGASRYDGTSFRNFTTNEGLPNNDVNTIIEDKTGKFWFGTRGDAFVYDGKTFTVFTHNGQPFTNVRKIIEDRKGDIWLGGADGFWRYDGSTFTNITRNGVGYIYEDKEGNIWTSSRRASDGKWILSRYGETSSFNKQRTVTEIESEYAGDQGMIFGILEADDGSIWFGTPNGVRRYDGNTTTDIKSK